MGRDLAAEEVSTNYEKIKMEEKKRSQLLSTTPGTELGP